MSLAVSPPPTGAVTDPLAPVREALLARARAEAAALLADADTAVGTVLASAEADAEAVRGEARTQGEADAAGVLADEQARARRRARAVVLTAQREAYDGLRRRVRAAAAGLAEDPAHAGLLAALEQRARTSLGAGATVVDDRAGGLVAHVGDREVAYRLADLADLAVDGLGQDVEGLWAP